MYLKRSSVLKLISYVDQVRVMDLSQKKKKKQFGFCSLPMFREQKLVIVVLKTLKLFFFLLLVTISQS